MTHDSSLKTLAKQLASLALENAGDAPKDGFAAHFADLQAARDILDGILQGLADAHDLDPPAPPEPAPLALLSGRYDGGNHALVMELRVDLDGSGVISGDLFGMQSGGRDYLASFRTAPGTRVSATDTKPWAAVFEDRHGAVLTGTLAIAPGTLPSAATVSLSIAGAIDGLPANRVFDLAAEWQSPFLRRLGIELERETGTEDPPMFDHNGRSMTFRRCFEDVGFEIFDAGSQSTIPKEPDGWGTAQLHALMTDFADAPLTRSTWRQQLLWLGKPSRSGLLGVMFDTTAQLPRQGTAVFDTEIRDIIPDKVERKIIQTTVHEIGHGLNLAHRFEREVGRADSNSFMNYDWRYKGGNRRHEFWDDFDFTFDADELEFLRHAPRNAVIPGGAAFHSINYWADGNGGYSPYSPEEPLDILDLRLDPPIGGAIFDFGQPVFLQITLTNNSGQSLDLDRRFLDPKGGFLQVLVRRINSGPGGSSGAMHYHPMLERCFDIDPGTLDIVQPGQSMSDNLNITFGSGGFTFAEPGRYEVKAVLALFDQDNDRELVAPSNALQIHVAHPQSREEEAEVVSVLHREDVGVYMALGGSSVMDAAEDSLKAVLERRQAGRKTVTDPIAANIVRCLGINAGRRYRRFRSGRYRASDGDPAASAAYLARLGREALRAFDNSTAEATVGLRKKQEARAKDAGKPKSSRRKS